MSPRPKGKIEFVNWENFPLGKVKVLMLVLVNQKHSDLDYSGLTSLNIIINQSITMNQKLISWPCIDVELGTFTLPCWYHQPNKDHFEMTLCSKWQIFKNKGNNNNEKEHNKRYKWRVRGSPRSRLYLKKVFCKNMNCK